MYATQQARRHERQGSAAQGPAPPRAARRAAQDLASPEAPQAAPPQPTPPDRVALAAITTTGSPLPPEVCADMEARLGGDFSTVRVHTDAAAAQAAAALSAEAYTVGEDIVFARGAFAPHDQTGRLRLAHELAHVLQQRRGAADAGHWHVSSPGDALELAAERHAQAALRGPGPSAAPAPGAPRAAAPAASSRARIIQRRAVAELSPAREAASDAAADSPWLGITAPGMLDFRGPAPKITPAQGASEPHGPAADTAPAGSQLDPLALPEPDPQPPEPSVPDQPAPSSEPEAARQAEHTDERAPDAPPGAAPHSAEHPSLTEPDDHRPAAQPAAAGTEKHDGQPPPTPETAKGSAQKPGAAPAGRAQRGADDTVALQLPQLPAEIAPEFSVLSAADRDGQRRLQAAVARALADVAAIMDRESARVDADATAAQNTVTTATRTARGQVYSAASAARSHVEKAAGVQRRRAGKQLAKKKSAVKPDVDDVVSNVKTAGKAKADAAQEVANTAATELEGARDDATSRARRTGTEHAGHAYSNAEEPEIARASVSAQQQAAHDIAEQTATEIDKAITSSAQDLRGGGPGLQREISNQLHPLLDNIRDQIEPMQASVDTVGDNVATSLNGAVEQARTTIEATSRGLINALAQIESQTKRQIVTAADTTKAGLRQASGDAQQQLHGKATEFVTAAHTELGQHLALISSRPVRRMLARRLANQLRTLLRNGYGTGANQANRLAGRVAKQLSDALAQFHEQLSTASKPAVEGTKTTAQSAGVQFGQLEHKVIEFLSSTVTDQLARLDASQSDRIENLGKVVGVVDDQLAPFVDQTRTRVDADKKTLLDDAHDKVNNLGDRVDQAMTKAHDKAEYGAFGAWLMDQLRSLGKAMLTPSFWVGLLVGLLITIFIVATFGSGTVVLIIAGAVSGAIAAAASYTAQVYLDPLADPKAPRKEFSASELGKQMVIGGVAGALGAGLGAGASKAVGAVVTEVAAQVTVNKVAQTVVGTTLGVVQNCMTGPDGGVHWQFNTEHWDEGLLTNVAVSAAMSWGPGEKLIEKTQTRARETMVDRGLARNVSADEFARAQTRFEARGTTEPAASRRPAVPDLSGIHVDPGPPHGAPTPEPPPPMSAPAPTPERPPPMSAPAPTPERPPPVGAPVPTPETHAPPPAETRPGAPTGPPPRDVAAPAPVEPHQGAEAPRPNQPVEQTPARAPAASPERVAPPHRERAGAHAPEHPAAAAPKTPERTGALAEKQAGTPHSQIVEGVPDLTVISTDEHMTAQQAKEIYENSRRDAKHQEVAIYRNSETGEHIVIQGNSQRVEARAEHNAALREFEQSRPGQSGRWELLEHSHPVDPTRGVTPEAQRLPTGRGGDFDVAHAESVARGGAPVEQKISIVTERGEETVRYGYDPSQERPYSLHRTGPDGQPITERFRSMEHYGEWYEKQPGTAGYEVHIDQDPGGGAAPRRDDSGKRQPPPTRPETKSPSGGPPARAKPPPLPDRARTQARAQPESFPATTHPAPAAEHVAPAPPVERPVPATKHVAPTGERAASAAQHAASAPPAEHDIAPPATHSAPAGRAAPSTEHPAPAAEHITPTGEHLTAAPPPEQHIGPPAEHPAPAGPGAPPTEHPALAAEHIPTGEHLAAAPPPEQHVAPPAEHPAPVPVAERPSAAPAEHPTPGAEHAGLPSKHPATAEHALPQPEHPAPPTEHATPTGEPPSAVPADEATTPATKPAAEEADAAAAAAQEARRQARAAKANELREIQKQNTEQIEALTKDLAHKQAKVDRYVKEAETAVAQKRYDDASRKWEQARAAAQVRDRVQSKVASLKQQNIQIEQQIAKLNRPPGSPQEAGRNAEAIITEVSGWEKNSKTYDTSFPDSRVPSGSRIPDFVPVYDETLGRWRNATGPAELNAGRVAFIADSKVLTETGEVKLTAQIKGFIELAKQTQFKGLLLITDQPVHPKVYKFAAQEYGVTVRTMSQPYF